MNLHNEFYKIDSYSRTNITQKFRLSESIELTFYLLFEILDQHCFSFLKLGNY